jgi:hypothetical protein
MARVDIVRIEACKRGGERPLVTLVDVFRRGGRYQAE